MTWLVWLISIQLKELPWIGVGFFSSMWRRFQFKACCLIFYVINQKTEFICPWLHHGHERIYITEYAKYTATSQLNYVRVIFPWLSCRIQWMRWIKPGILSVLCVRSVVMRSVVEPSMSRMADLTVWKVSSEKWHSYMDNGGYKKWFIFWSWRIITLQKKPLKSKPRILVRGLAYQKYVPLKSKHGKELSQVEQEWDMSLYWRSKLA